MKIEIKKLPKSEIEITGEIQADVFESYFQKSLKKIGENLEIDGFRKGKIPENIIISNVSEIRILEEMAEMALSEHYPEIIKENNIDPISQPEIQITKLARNNPLEFKIITSVLPEIKLPDYKKIASETLQEIESDEKEIVITDEEVENTILDIRKARAPKVNIKDAKEEDIEKQKSELPEFNDEFVKSLGEFENTNDFIEKLKVNLKIEKENSKRERTRLKIIEKIIEATELDLPEILISLELEKIIYRMESDVSQMGIKFEDYLKHLNKNMEDLRKEFRQDAEKKAKLSLILNEISKIENIKADETEVLNEVNHILEHYKDADKDRARIYAENILTNEKIFQMLESQN